MDVLFDYWPIVGFASFFVVALLFSLLFRRRTPLPYEMRPALLTRSELQFLTVLREAVDDRWDISPMVRMADILRVREEANQRQSWQNRILAKHIDFLLCDSGSMEIKLAIELDDRSHRRTDRVTRDAFVNKAFAAADVPLIRVPVRREYDPETLRATIDKRIAAA